MSERREPLELAASLRAVSRELGLAPTDVLERVTGIWRTAVPAHLVARARPRTLRAARLVVAVDDPGVATELRYCERAVLEACAAELGPEVVQRVDVVVDRDPRRGADEPHT